MSLVLWFSAVLLCAGGFALRNPSLLFLALPLLAAPLAALLTMPAGPRRLGLAWSSEGTGPQVLIEGRLSGADPEAARSIAVEFRRPEPLGEDRPPRLVREHGDLRFTLSWTAPYPMLAKVPIPEATLVDPLRLVERPIEISGAPLELQRFPPEAERAGSAPLHRTTPLPGEVASRSRGATGEFFGVRPAAPGDSPRQFNWRASGRTGRLTVNEFLLDRTGDLVIVLDARPTGLGPEIDRALLAIGKAAAHGIVRGFLREKNRVGIAVFGEYLEAVPLSGGRTQRFRLGQLLSSARISEEAGPPERLAVALRRAYPPGVSTLVISPLADTTSFEVLPHLRRRGFPTFVLSPSPLPLLTPWFAGGEEDQALARLLRLIRRARVGRVWEDAPILDWEDYWSLGSLEGLFRVPSHRRGVR